VNVLTRKQREVAERHALFLTIGRELLESEGFPNLSMDRIADLAEYSKGTVYQHFRCKEEVLIQLCNQCIQELTDLFERASMFTGNHRERLMAVFFAHDIWMRLNPSRATMLQTLGAEGVKNKAEQSSVDEHNQLEARLIGTVSQIVQDACNDKDLQLDETLNPVELVFGLWSMSYGGQLIQHANVPLKELGIRDPGATLIRTSNAMLDGLGWTPLSTKHDYQQTEQRIATDLFSAEFAQLGVQRDHEGQDS